MCIYIYIYTYIYCCTYCIPVLLSVVWATEDHGKRDGFCLYAGRQTSLSLLPGQMGPDIHTHSRADCNY